MLMDDDSTLIKEEATLKLHIVGFYEKLLGTAYARDSIEEWIMCNSPLVSTKAGTRLIVEVTEREINEAPWSIATKKAPGPGGFSSGFFRSSWHILAQMVFEAVKEFFEAGKLCRQINATSITLIPKNDKPLNIREFRPLSCCNVVLKVIT